MLDVISVAIGITLFLVALPVLWRAYRIGDAGPLRGWWTTLACFVTFFLLGYVLFLLALLRDEPLGDVRLLVSQIFLWGSVFVLLCAFLLLASLRQRLAVERELREAHERVDQSRRLEAMGLLAGAVAHDFNNSLTTIMGLAEVRGSMTPPDSQAALDFNEILTVAENSADLSRQLLAFSGGQVLQAVNTSVTKVIAKQEQALRTTLGHSIGLTVVGTASAETSIDVNLLELVLVNLCVNAREAMPMGGEVVIRVEEQKREAQDGICITVEDTGDGIPPNLRRRIFDPFFTTKKSADNVGLGLASAHGIIKQHGGTITAASAEGRGACLVIWLPKTPVSPATPVEEVSRSKTPARDVPARRQVLVVDDDHHVRGLMLRHLQKGGFETTQAADFDEALTIAVARAGAFDLVISDIVMPGRSGIELSSELKDRFPALPVLLVTGYSKTSSELADLDPNVAVCHKPFTGNTLREHVARLLNTSSPR